MPSILNATTSSGLVTSADNSGSLQLQTNNGTTAVTIDTSQNVGIGTSSPSTNNGAVSRLLDMAGANNVVLSSTNTNTDFNFIIEAKRTGRTTSTRFAQVQLMNSSDNGSINFYTAPSGSDVSERMRITSGGDLLVGTTTNLNAKVGIIGSSGVSSINCGDALDTNTYGIVQIVRPADQPDNKFHLAFIRNGNKIAGMGFLDNSDTFAIQNPGIGNNSGAGVTLTHNATSWGTTSDERKKDIIAPIENGLAKLADWRSVYYKYKTDEETDPQRVGLIAQDVQATLPEAISVEEDEIQTLQLRYTEVIPVLVKAIQELNTDLANTKLLLTEVSNKVEAQAARIAELEGAK